jgi:hypothetical protein
MYIILSRKCDDRVGGWSLFTSLLLARAWSGNPNQRHRNTEKNGRVPGLPGTVCEEETDELNLRSLQENDGVHGEVRRLYSIEIRLAIIWKRPIQADLALLVLLSSVPVACPSMWFNIWEAVF